MEPSAKLDRIEVAGFKSLKEVSIELRPGLNVFIGANGSGKTNMIEVFRLLHAMVELSLQSYVVRKGGGNSLLWGGPKLSKAITLGVAFKGGINAYGCELVFTEDDSVMVDKERVWFHDPVNYLTPLVKDLGAPGLESRLPRSEEPIAQYVRRALKSWIVYHFHDTTSTAAMKLTGDIHDNRYLHSDGGNLAAFLYMLKQTKPGHYQRIVKTVQMIAPFFEDFELEPTKLKPDAHIRLRWRQRGMEKGFNASDLSDGTLRFICLATVFLMPDRPATIVVDEPELGLHPAAITLLVALMRSAAVDSQIVISTHSVFLLNQLDLEEVFVVEWEEGASSFTLATEKVSTQAVEDAVGEIWLRNMVGGRP